jgi:hypothetical protein
VVNLIKNINFINYLRESFFTNDVNVKAIDKVLFFKFAIQRLKKNKKFDK